MKRLMRIEGHNIYDDGTLKRWDGVIGKWRVQDGGLQILYFHPPQYKDGVKSEDYYANSKPCQPSLPPSGLINLSKPALGSQLSMAQLQAAVALAKASHAQQIAAHNQLLAANNITLPPQDELPVFHMDSYDMRFPRCFRWMILPGGDYSQEVSRELARMITA